MKHKIPLLDKRYSKHRPVSDDEVELWLESVKEEKPAAFAKPPRSKPKPKPENTVTSVAVKKKRHADPQASIIDRVASAKIRRGKIAIEATLDLHGHTRETAFALLVRFITQAQARGLRVILVITGKGNKEKEGILRKLLPVWFNETPLRERIIAYDNASPRHGGSGAWYVRIRKGARF